MKKFIVKSLFFLSIALAIGGALYFLSWQIRLVWLEIVQGIDHTVISDVYLELLAVKMLPVFGPTTILALCALWLHEKLRWKWQIPIC